MAVEQPGTRGGRALPVSSMDCQVQQGRVHVRDRNGVWEVKVDGRFCGDYTQEDHALAAAALLKLSLR